MRRAPKALRLASPGTRLRFALFAVAFLLSLFAGRLLQLQGVDASAYATVADSERRFDEVVLATRGDILDRNGVALATTIESVNVYADQTLVRNPALTARMLAPFVDVDVTELESRLSGDRRFIYLAKDVDIPTWDEIRALELDGIQAERTHRRTYPGGDLAANVLGFVDAAGVGQAGVEQAYEATLHGSDGAMSYLRDGSGRRIPSGASTERPAVPGRDVELTIDRDLQYLAQKALAAKVEEAGARSGDIVVMTPEGEILAMATSPSFDPGEAWSTPLAQLGNRVVSDIYEPGSVLKVITMAAVLEEGLWTPGSIFTVPDSIVIDGGRYRDHSPHATEQMTLAGVLADSSNVGTVQAADPMSRETQDGYLRAFGVGSPTGVGLPNDATGLMPSLDWDSSRHTAAFGQGLSLSTLQVASVYATIANGGVRVTPTVVRGVTDEDGRLSSEPAGDERRVVSEATADQVAQMLEMVVSDGTGPAGAVEGYRVAGKTGTAEYADPACGCYRGYTASYSGFAPADDPAIVISIALHKPTKGHYGGMLAGPVFADVMSYALQKFEVPPTGTPPAALPLREGDTPVNSD